MAPINIRQPDLRGLASVSRGSDLSNLGGLGLSAIRQLQQAQQTQQQLALERMRLQDQSGLGLLANNRANRALDQQKYLTERAQDLQGRQLAQNERKMAMQGQQFQDSLGLKQQALAQQGALGQSELALKEKALQQQQMQKELARLMDQDKAELDKKGNFAAYVASAMENAKSPEEANMIRVEALKNAVKDGILSKKEANQYSKLPLSQFANQAKYQAMVLGKVSEMKAGLDKKQPTMPGVTIGADGSIDIRQEPTTPSRNKAQGELMDRQRALRKLGGLRENFKRKYFTTKGRLGLGASKMAEEAEGMPYAGVLDTVAGAITGQNKEERAKYIREATSYLNAVDQFFQQEYRKPITGAQAALQELKDLRSKFLSGDMSPSEAMGALDAIVIRYTSEEEYNKNVLGKGLDITPSESAPSNLSERINAYKDAGKSEEEINEYLRKKGWIK